MTFVSLLEKPKSCHLCDKDAVVQHYTFAYCRSCYLHLLEKRIKKALRGKLKRNVPLFVVDNLAAFFFQRLYPHFAFQSLSLEDWQQNQYPKDSLLVVPLTMDDFIAQNFEALFFRKLSFGEDDSQIIPLFQYVRDEELQVAAQLLNKTFRPLPKAYPLASLEEMFLGIGSRFFQNMQALRTILQKKH